ncbi:MAG: lipoprotein-releasing system ATP-binding protein LolD [Candidatus Cloacimonetes bacterium HGW-Cloacimonetes-3]|jgi:ABC-type lipoprotein export system ATPase subunit|nr:MAG: lipoprotein-releasing system ATP-binding protein LolD [Candidatus Cloacimonetes bacterium HGW-Cloacimonetes-3]
MFCLAAYNLTKSYIDSDQSIHVLSDANLEVREAEMISITGQSGCGKSTLLHILGLLDTPDTGRVLIGGREVHSGMPEAPMIRNKDLGFVFQFHYLVEDLTACENVALPMIIAGNNSTDSLKRATELLSSLGLEDRLNRYANQLSGGEQQRVSLARALINSPKIVLADEPTGNLDPQHSAEVWQMILNLNKEHGQAFVIVTHDTDSARLASQTYNLAQGKLSLC